MTYHLKTSMHITGSQYDKLSQAIIRAYPSHGTLKKMVRIELEENLDAIAGQEALNIVVPKLIDWAEAEGKVESLIVGAYNQNSGNPKLKEFYQSIILQQRFIIQPALIDTTKDIGPPIDWHEPIEELQLESLFKPEPDFWDMNFLKRAVEQAASVCHLEIPSQNIQGTGVLIADRLVLTNYHVLQPDESASMQANALDAVLLFNYFTSDSGNETQGHVFRLDRQNPILHFSPTDKLDYVLLQVENNILEAKDIQPARWDANTLPVKGMGISLLQHPQGESMKLSISRDGVAGVYQERGLVQYVNKTALGSSGAPCFDENWKIVALHHAQRGTTFGTIREGILFSSIFQEIQSYLTEKPGFSKKPGF